MTELQKQFEATGYASWINAEIYPNGKIYTQEYTEWLEKRLEALDLPNVEQQSELLISYNQWLIDNKIKPVNNWCVRDFLERNQ